MTKFRAFLTEVGQSTFRPQTIVMSGWIVLITFLLMLSFRTCARHGGGIQDGLAGQVVYLEGEACTVNYTPDAAEFQKRLDWCAEWYKRDRAHLTEKTP